MPIAPSPVPRALTVLPYPPKCLEVRGVGQTYSVRELEEGVTCYRDDAGNIRERFARLRNAVRAREAVASRAQSASNISP